MTEEKKLMTRTFTNLNQTVEKKNDKRNNIFEKIKEKYKGI